MKGGSNMNAPMQRGIVRRFTLPQFSDGKAGIAFVIRLWLVLGVPVGLLLKLLGLRFLAGPIAAYVVILIGAILAPFVSWLVGGIRTGQFLDTYKNHTTSWLAVQGVLVGASVANIIMLVNHAPHFLMVPVGAGA